MQLNLLLVLWCFQVIWSFFHLGLSFPFFQWVVLGGVRQVTLHQGVTPAGMPGTWHFLGDGAGCPLVKFITPDRRCQGNLITPGALWRAIDSLAWFYYGCHIADTSLIRCPFQKSAACLTELSPSNTPGMMNVEWKHGIYFHSSRGRCSHFECLYIVIFIIFTGVLHITNRLIRLVLEF